MGLGRSGQPPVSSLLTPVLRLVQDWASYRNIIHVARIQLLYLNRPFWYPRETPLSIYYLHLGHRAFLPPAFTLICNCRAYSLDTSNTSYNVRSNQEPSQSLRIREVKWTWHPASRSSIVDLNHILRHFLRDIRVVRNFHSRLPGSLRLGISSQSRADHPVAGCP